MVVVRVVDVVVVRVVVLVVWLGVVVPALVEVVLGVEDVVVVDVVVAAVLGVVVVSEVNGLEPVEAAVLAVDAESGPGVEQAIVTAMTRVARHIQRHLMDTIIAPARGHLTAFRRTRLTICGVFPGAGGGSGASGAGGVRAASSRGGRSACGVRNRWRRTRCRLSRTGRDAEVARSYAEVARSYAGGWGSGLVPGLAFTPLGLAFAAVRALRTPALAANASPWGGGRHEFAPALHIYNHMVV